MEKALAGKDVHLHRETQAGLEVANKTRETRTIKKATRVRVAIVKVIANSLAAAEDATGTRSRKDLSSRKQR